MISSRPRFVIGEEVFYIARDWGGQNCWRMAKGRIVAVIAFEDHWEYEVHDRDRWAAEENVFCSMQSAVDRLKTIAGELHGEEATEA
jgi:hypothetical protein